MNVAQVMSRKVVSISPTAPFRDIWKIIFKNKINSVPVVDAKDRIVGILAREELLERLFPDYRDLFASGDDLPDFEDLEQKVRQLSGLKASDLMRKRVVFAHEGTPVMRALSRMIVRRINQLPVVDDKDKLVGMITKGDIFYSLFKKNMKKSSAPRKKPK